MPDVWHRLSEIFQQPFGESVTDTPLDTPQNGRVTPVTPATPAIAPDEHGADTEEFEERAALIEFGADVPREWAEGYARLGVSHRPAGFTDREWGQLITNCGLFLDKWGALAAELGWSLEDVFGVHPTAASARHDYKGLVLLVEGGRVVELTADKAKIRLSSGAQQSFTRPKKPDAIPVWDLPPPDDNPAHDFPDDPMDAKVPKPSSASPATNDDQWAEHDAEITRQILGGGRQEQR